MEELMIAIPIIGTVSAGKPGDWLPTDGLRWVRPLKNTSHMQGVIAMRVNGDSMMGDGIMDGDFAIIQMVDIAPPEKIVVVRTPHGLTVKRVIRQHDTVILRSSNPIFKDQAWPVEDICLIGVVRRIERDYL